MVIAILFALSGAAADQAQSQPRIRVPFSAPCSAVMRLPDGRWQTKSAIALGAGKLSAGTIIGKGGDVDELMVDGRPVTTDIAERCGSKAG